MKMFYVYILASSKNGVLYVGVTNNLHRRLEEHKGHVMPGFTDKYFVGRLVYFEQTENVESAISREKRLKKWNRAWKVALIEESNPNWADLSQTII